MATDDRRGFLGATDIAAILGLSPWRTPWVVWAEKTGRLEPQPPNLVMRLGLAIEPELLRWASESLGPLRPGGSVAIDGTPIVCHPDALTADGCPVEAKTTGLLGPECDDWGEPYTDEIPTVYLVQVHVQIAAMRAAQAYVPVLRGRRGCAMYVVQRQDRVAQDIVAFAVDWWNRYVLADTPPPDSAPTMEAIKRLKRKRGKRVALDERAQTLLDEYRDAESRLREAEQQLDRAKAALIAALGDAEEGVAIDGTRITYSLVRRRGYVVPESQYRVLRITQEKKNV